jgi:hypothetical protein
MRLVVKLTVPSLTRRQSWRMAKRRTSSIFAPVSPAKQRPFSSTLAQWAMPWCPSQRRA